MIIMLTNLISHSNILLKIQTAEGKHISNKLKAEDTKIDMTENENSPKTEDEIPQKDESENLRKGEPDGADNTHPDGDANPEPPPQNPEGVATENIDGEPNQIAEAEANPHIDSEGNGTTADSEAKPIADSEDIKAGGDESTQVTDTEPAPHVADGDAIVVDNEASVVDNGMNNSGIVAEEAKMEDIATKKGKTDDSIPPGYSEAINMEEISPETE